MLTLPAAWADMLRRLARLPEAADAYARAAALSDNQTVRTFLEDKATELRNAQA